MSKHTPGPWALNGFYIDFDGATRIATVSNWRMSGVDAHAEAKANARLIAAAPELLEALEMCISSMESLLPDFNPFDQAAYDKALAAIAKAKGEQA